MADHSHQLPKDKLIQIQSSVLDHFKSLNAAGKFKGEKVSREDALKALGFESEQAGEQWLCSIDGNCGVKGV